MTNKPFEVQYDAIVLNGVELQITQEGNINIDNNPVSGGGGTTQTHLVLTNSPFIVQPVQLGTPVSFVRTDQGSETDQIDTGLTIARGAQGALYNIESELSYDNTNHTSPAGTEWNSDGWGNLLSLGSRSYSTLRSVLNNAIGGR